VEVEESFNISSGCIFVNSLFWVKICEGQDRRFC
jgi:hypothetical protein